MKPYYELLNKSIITNKLLDIANNSDEWFYHFNFETKLVPLKLLLEDEFFIWLFYRYKFIASVLKLDPYICYNWHTDSRRGVSINMLLTPDARSFCVFGDSIHKSQIKIEDLCYKPDTYYLFNTQVPHTVFNFETTRYMLSIEFSKDLNNLTFDQLMHDVRSNYEHGKNN